MLGDFGVLTRDDDVAVYNPASVPLDHSTASPGCVIHAGFTFYQQIGRGRAD